MWKETNYTISTKIKPHRLYQGKIAPCNSLSCALCGHLPFRQFRRGLNALAAEGFAFGLSVLNHIDKDAIDLLNPLISKLLRRKSFNAYRKQTGLEYALIIERHHHGPDVHLNFLFSYLPHNDFATVKSFVDELLLTVARELHHTNLLAQPLPLVCVETTPADGLARKSNAHVCYVHKDILGGERVKTKKTLTRHQLRERAFFLTNNRGRVCLAISRGFWRNLSNRDSAAKHFKRAWTDLNDLAAKLFQNTYDPTRATVPSVLYDHLYTKGIDATFDVFYTLESLTRPNLDKAFITSTLFALGSNELSIEQAVKEIHRGLYLHHRLMKMCRALPVKTAVVAHLNSRSSVSELEEIFSRSVKALTLGPITDEIPHYINCTSLAHDPNFSLQFRHFQQPHFAPLKTPTLSTPLSTHDGTSVSACQRHCAHCAPVFTTPQSALSTLSAPSTPPVDPTHQPVGAGGADKKHFLAAFSTLFHSALPDLLSLAPRSYRRFELLAQAFPLPVALKSFAPRSYLSGFAGLYRLKLSFALAVGLIPFDETFDETFDENTPPDANPTFDVLSASFSAYDPQHHPDPENVSQSNLEALTTALCDLTSHADRLLSGFDLGLDRYL